MKSFKEFLNSTDKIAEADEKQTFIWSYVSRDGKVAGRLIAVGSQLTTRSFVLTLRDYKTDKVLATKTYASQKAAQRDWDVVKSHGLAGLKQIAEATVKCADCGKALSQKEQKKASGTCDACDLDARNTRDRKQAYTEDTHGHWKPSPKEITGFLKVRAAEKKSSMGGITHNDAYNTKTFGITQDVYSKIAKRAAEKHGHGFWRGEVNTSKDVVKLFEASDITARLNRAMDVALAAQPHDKIALWKYHKVAGMWRLERMCKRDDAEKWLDIFQKDDPTYAFALSKVRPSKKPDRKYL